MATTSPDVDARAITRRRRRAAVHSAWTVFRHNRQAVAGALILLVAVIVAILSPLLVPASAIDPATATGPICAPPSWAYPLGTDNFGRSVLALVVVGTRVSLIVGIAATVGAILVGATIGILAGYYGGGRVDRLLSTLIDWFLVIPWLVLAIVLAAILGPTLINVIVVIAVTSWAMAARIVRSQVLSVRKQGYVERARALGSGDGAIMAHHILPNVFPVIFAQAVLTVAIAILSETTLSILGLGDPASISWGRIIEDAFEGGAMVNGYWWWIMPPGIAVVLVTLAFTMCGYAFEEILDPRLRGLEKIA